MDISTYSITLKWNKIQKPLHNKKKKNMYNIHSYKSSREKKENDTSINKLTEQSILCTIFILLLLLHKKK